MSGDPFRAAARAYFVYGVIYWVGGAYLASRGVGVRSGDGFVWSGVLWVAVGLVLVLLIPFLLRAPRAWFERWILSRRDFARILALFMAFRAFQVGRIALRPESPSVALPWAGAVSFRTGAAVFFIVTVVALVFVARAAWQCEVRPSDGRAERGGAS
jgi:hypothetical protein